MEIKLSLDKFNLLKNKLLIECLFRQYKLPSVWQENIWYRPGGTDFG